MHNAVQIDLLANPILHFGVIKPVVTDDRGGIVAGHGIWLAAKKLGLKQIPVIRVSRLSETQLRAYALPLAHRLQHQPAALAAQLAHPTSLRRIPTLCGATLN